MSTKNYLELVKKFKKQNGSRFAQESSEDCLLMFLDFILKEQGSLNEKPIKGEYFSDNICLDEECYCGKYTMGDVMKNCDGGCMYPGA